MERSYDEPLWLDEVLFLASLVTGPYVDVILFWIFGTTVRTTSGAVVGVSGIPDSCDTEGADGAGDSFGAIEVLRGAALDFVSDDPIGLCFGGGGR